MLTKKAIVYAWEGQATIAAMRRAALLFDEVLYIPTVVPTLLPTARHRVPVGTGDSPPPDLYNSVDWGADFESRYFALTEAGSRSPLGPTVSALAKENVLRLAPGIRPGYSDSKFSSNSNLFAVRSSLLRSEMADRGFQDACGVGAVLPFLEPTGMFRVITPGRQPCPRQDYITVKAPVSWCASHALTSLLYTADASGALPLIAEPVMTAALQHRHRVLASAVKQHPGMDGCPPELEKFAASFVDQTAGGVVLFALLQSLFSDDELLALSDSDVTSLRKKYTQARGALLDQTLNAYSDLIESADRGSAVDNQIARFTDRELGPALRKFHNDALHEREKLIGRVSASVLDAISWGGGSGLVGMMYRGTSLWGLTVAAFAASGWGLKAVPSVGKQLIDYWIADRNLRRSGIAYFSAIKQTVAARSQPRN